MIWTTNKSLKKVVVKIYLKNITADDGVNQIFTFPSDVAQVYCIFA